VLGELVPKSLALRAGQTYALLVAKPLLALSWLARPVVWLLTASSNLVLRPFSDRTNFAEIQVSREELHHLVNEATATGAVDVQTGELASRALEFDQLTLREVMIPRHRVDALPHNASLQDIHRFVLEVRRSRIPVYSGRLDNVIGYVSAKDVVSLIFEGKLVVLQDILRPVGFFPETMLAVEVLRSMRHERQRIAMAVDEHGALSGLVTLEDMLEELVGDMFSEREKKQAAITRAPDGSALVLGETDIREVNRALGLRLDEPEDVSTMAGLCAKLAGGMPHRHARLAASDGTVLVVQDASVRTVRLVRVIPARREET
jgi:putative hemolysin